MNETTAVDYGTINPDDDGKAFINVYSKGKTRLGQLLSNFADTPFRHPKHGNFASVEAFWYWASSGCRHDHLRRLHGFSAKSAGVKCEVVPIPDSEFHEMVREAIECKVMQNPELRALLVSTDLPFVHFYVYGDGSKRVIVHKDKHDWQMQWLEELRRRLKGTPTNDAVVEGQLPEGISAEVLPDGNFRIWGTPTVVGDSTFLLKNDNLRCYTVEEIKADGYQMSGLTHHGEIPTGKLNEYARVLHWDASEVIAIRTGPSAWAICRKAPQQASGGEEHWDNA